MNGVRRLLGGSSSSPPSDPASSSVMPLFSSKHSASTAPNASWSASNSDNYSASGSPKTTPGLFLRKDKPRPLLSDDHGSWESGRSSNHAHQSSTSSIHSSLNRNGSLHSSTSSPRLVPVNGERNLSRRTTEESTDSAWIVKRNSTLSTTRDELLMSLMASEAVVDSREYDVLNAEEVEELKKEHALLSTRVAALQKKVALETKIRDAAASLSKVNSAQKRVSKQTDDHLESANKRVDAAQKELWRLSEHANEIGRRLLEHRAAVLSISVRNMEKKMAVSSEDSGYDSSNRSTLMSPPSATSAFSSSSKQAKFDGPHLFAGHENTVVPRRKLSPEAASKEITALEDRLKAATATLAESSKIQAEMKKELSHLKLEKQEVETTMGLELQTAEDKIASMEKALPRLDELDNELQGLRQQQLEWEEERRRLEENAKEAAVMKDRVEELQNGVAEQSGGAAKMLNELREAHQRELAERDEQMRQLKDEFSGERAGWERERNAMEDEKMDDLARLQQEMDQLRALDEEVLQQANDELNLTLNSLRKIVQQFNIPLAQRDSRTSAMQNLLSALTQHLIETQSKAEELARGGEGRERSRQLEVELQRTTEKLQTISAELDETRKERDAAKRETIASSARSITSSPRSKTDSIRTPPAAYSNLANITPESSEFGPDTAGAKFIAALQPVWAILPSPEARAAKFSTNNSRSYRAQGSPSLSTSALPSPAGTGVSATSQAPTSLSDLDVRSLKTLYDPRQQAVPGSPLNGQFTLEGFIARVNALVTDDRALIERLLRFAQAHDLLKKNAERAQKLAQDGNIALETYQRQVKLLEANNSSLRLKVAELQDELRLLHDAIERLTAEKHQLEAFAAEQAETCRQLSEANDTLSARALNLAEEAANAPEIVRKQLDDVKRQLDDNKKLLEDRTKELEDARDEVDAMRSAEQGQRIALLDELNTMQTENAQLRQQLRAAKSGR